MANPEKVVVRWVDSTQTEPGWTFLSDLAFRDQPPIIESVGYLLNDGEDVVTFANSYDSGAEAVEGIFTIPTVAIISMVKWK